MDQATPKTPKGATTTDLGDLEALVPMLAEYNENERRLDALAKRLTSAQVDVLWQATDPDVLLWGKRQTMDALYRKGLAEKPVIGRSRVTLDGYSVVERIADGRVRHPAITYTSGGRGWL